jgi:hypothetical protein
MPSKACVRSKARALLVQVLELDLLLARAVEHDVGGRHRQLFEGDVGVDAVMRGERLQHLEIELVAPVPALDGAGRERKVRVGHHARRIEELDLAQAVALLAGAHRVVEGEQARFEFLQRVVADRAGELRREQVLLAGIHFHGERAALGMHQGGFESSRPGAGARRASP